MAESEDLEQLSEDLGAVAAFEAERQLSDEEAVGEADIVASAADFVGQVLLLAAELGEGGGELDGGCGGRVGLDEAFEQLHDGGGQDVHAEEAEVMAVAQAGHDEALLGLGGGGFFEDGLDGVEAGGAGEQAAADGAIIGELAFVGGLDGGDGALVLAGDIDQLLGAVAAFVADVEVVADEEQKGVMSDELAGAVDGVAEAEGGGPG